MEKNEILFTLQQAFLGNKSLISSLIFREKNMKTRVSDQVLILNKIGQRSTIFIKFSKLTW